MIHLVEEPIKMDCLFSDMSTQFFLRHNICRTYTSSFFFFFWFLLVLKSLHRKKLNFFFWCIFYCTPSFCFQFYAFLSSILMWVIAASTILNKVILYNFFFFLDNLAWCCFSKLKWICFFYSCICYTYFQILQIHTDVLIIYYIISHLVTR